MTHWIVNAETMRFLEELASLPMGYVHHGGLILPESLVEESMPSWADDAYDEDEDEEPLGAVNWIREGF